MFDEKNCFTMLAALVEKDWKICLKRATKLQMIDDFDQAKAKQLSKELLDVQKKEVVKQKVGALFKRLVYGLLVEKNTLSFEAL